MSIRIRFCLVRVSVLVCLLFGDASAHDQSFPVLYLNGTGAYAELPSEITDSLNRVTVEAWVKCDEEKTQSQVFNFGKEGYAAALGIDGQSVYFSLRDRVGKHHTLKREYVFRPKTWQHWAVVLGVSGMKLYLDGEEVDVTGPSSLLSDVSGGNNYIGKSNSPGYKPFKGYISEFRIWAMDRPQAAIKETMYIQLTGKEEGLYGYWRFGLADAKNIRIKDETGNAHNLVLRDGAKVLKAPGPPLDLSTDAYHRRQIQILSNELEGKERTIGRLSSTIDDLQIENAKLGNTIADLKRQLEYSGRDAEISPTRERLQSLIDSTSKLEDDINDFSFR